MSVSDSGDALPVCSVLDELVDTLRRHRAAVLTAPPGAGKTTVVPLALLDAGLLEEGQLLLLEPRRVAARASAARMAAERGEAVGGTVGYQVRFDRRASSSTRIMVITEGILPRRFASDPFLEGVSAVILDEFHERSVHSDLALAFCRELMQVREDLLLLVMSATMDAEAVSRYLGGCPVVRGVGRTFPLTIEHVGAVDRRPLTDRAVAGVRTALATAPGEGDVLLFMPGAREIRRVTSTLSAARLSGTPEVVPLFGALSSADQDRALRPGSRRRVVVATNIAETSLTIPGITAVVDTGLVKIARYDSRLGLDRLETVSISRQSATQRAGRAGRIAPGYALRLWTEHEHRGRLQADIPEIRRLDPAPVLLQILAFHPGDPRRYELLDAPDEALAERAVDLFRQLGAIGRTGYDMTERGRRLAACPVHPRLGAILLRSGELDQADLGATTVALASERDICLSEEGAPGADHVVDFEYRLELLRAFERRGRTREAARDLGLSRTRAELVLGAKVELSRIAEGRGHSSSSGEGRISAGRLLLAGFPDRVCRRRPGSGQEALMVGGRGVRLRAPWWGDAGTDLFLSLEAEAGKRGAGSVSTVFVAAMLTRADLETEHPDLLTRHTRLAFDDTGRRVVERTEERFVDLVIDERPGAGAAPEAVARILAEAAIARWPAAFAPDDRAVRLVQRISFARSVSPGLALPDTTDAGLQALLEPLCYGKRAFDELQHIDWYEVLGDQLSYRARRELDDLFPERLTTPAGRSVMLDYAPAVSREAPGPVLACRLQELFGLMETPRVAGGRIPVTLHLLAPNGRPCQITQDLASFWLRTYPEVRKTLKGRYPKHYWPEDPLSAIPTSRVRPGRPG